MQGDEQIAKEIDEKFNNFESDGESDQHDLEDRFENFRN